jgi:hypothetical protein
MATSYRRCGYGGHSRTRILDGARLLRRVPERAPPGQPDPGAAGLLRRSHLRARRWAPGRVAPLQLDGNRRHHHRRHLQRLRRGGDTANGCRDTNPRQRARIRRRPAPPAPWKRRDGVKKGARRPRLGPLLRGVLSSPGEAFCGTNGRCDRLPVACGRPNSAAVLATGGTPRPSRSEKNVYNAATNEISGGTHTS